MKLETALRRIEKVCRDNLEVFGSYEAQPSHRDAPGAKGEARGICMASDEIKAMCRQIRAESKLGKVERIR